MANHYNLYYLFLEDKNANLMSREKHTQIKNIILDRYKIISMSRRFSLRRPCDKTPDDCTDK